MSREIRLQKILQLLSHQQGLTVGEIRRFLEVSPMTLYRDLRELEDRNLVRRVRGGVLSENPILIPTQGSCALCGRELPVRTHITLLDSKGGKTHACCSHCGFGLMKHHEGYESILGMDFLSDTVLDLEKGHFLVRPQIKLCCEPAVLVFARHEDALRMQKGFGGEIMSFETVRNLLC